MAILFCRISYLCFEICAGMLSKIGLGTALIPTKYIIVSTDFHFVSYRHNVQASVISKTPFKEYKDLGTKTWGFIQHIKQI